MTWPVMTRNEFPRRRRNLIGSPLAAIKDPPGPHPGLLAKASRAGYTGAYKNQQIMPRSTIAAAVFGIIMGSLPAPHARSEAARAALIIGNATYTTLPGIPG